MEVEILVAEVGGDGDADALYHVLYDGSVLDEQGFSVMGGEAEAIAERLKAAYDADADLAGALRSVRQPPSPVRSARSPPTSSRSRCSSAAPSAVRSGASRAPSSRRSSRRPAS